jgi:hypothetical protein
VPSSAPHHEPAGSTNIGFFAKAKQALFGVKTTESAESETVRDATARDVTARDGMMSSVAFRSDPVYDDSTGDAATTDPVFDVLMTQRADGSFLDSAPLRALLGTARCASLVTALGQGNDAVVTTATVIALLEREHFARESEWRPAVDKAKLWLAKQTTTFEPSSIV